jgi:plasmid maintenance system antidote protein VapI
MWNILPGMNLHRTRQERGEFFSAGARRLWKYLDASGISAARFAESIDVHKSTLSRWMHGDRPIPIEWAFVIERMTGIPVAAWVPHPKRAA